LQTLLNRLNHQQFQVVTAPEGHLLINAAAGTGKTSTLAARILFLQIEKGIEPTKMLALSFSRSARQGLIDKLETYRQDLGTGSPIETLTFHGLAFRILRIAAGFGETWLKPGFKLIESKEVVFEKKGKAFFKEIEPKQNMASLYAKAIDVVRQGHPELDQAYILPKELPKGKIIKIETEPSIKVGVDSNDLKRVWNRYQVYLKRTNQIDFSGLITEAIAVLLNEDSATARRVRQGLHYLFIDEYQDTSKAQEKMAFLFAANQMHLNVVGDNEQTIYTFNGSNVENILNFYDCVTQSGAQVLEPIDLTENYRSSSNILTLANRIVEQGHSLYKKELKPAVHVSETVKSYQLNNYPIQLVRVPRISNAADFIAQEIQKLVKEEQIPYRDITVLVRKDSEFSPQGTEVKKVFEQYGIPVGMKKKEASNTIQLYEVTEEFCQYHYDEALVDLIYALENGQYKEELNGTDSEEIIKILNEAVQTGADFAYDALDFLIDANSEESEGISDDGVQIRTVHSAKGLEFRVVFVLFIGDRSFPHGAKPDIEEERRLFYVAITRAQERLFIIGKNGIHGPDFFGECYGEGTELFDYFTHGNTEEKAEKNEELIAEVDDTKKALKEEDEKQRERLMALFDDEDF